MHFRPLHDRVLVRRIEAEEKTAGGIIIPDTAKEKPMEGEVVAELIAIAPHLLAQGAGFDSKPGCEIRVHYYRPAPIMIHRRLVCVRT